MANTYTLIASSTVGAGGAASVSFSSIPQTYTDLVIKLSLRDDDSTNPYNRITLTFNGSNTYNSRNVYGTGSGTNSQIANVNIDRLYDNGSSATASVFGNGEIYIPNYTGTTAKSISADTVSENNATAAVACLTAGYSSLTSAITSITITVTGFGFAGYSTAYLYGIKNS